MLVDQVKALSVVVKTGLISISGEITAAKQSWLTRLEDPGGSTLFTRCQEAAVECQQEPLRKERAVGERSAAKPDDMLTMLLFGKPRSTNFPRAVERGRLTKPAPRVFGSWSISSRHPNVKRISIKILIHALGMGGV